MMLIMMMVLIMIIAFVLESKEEDLRIPFLGRDSIVVLVLPHELGLLMMV